MPSPSFPARCATILALASACLASRVVCAQEATALEQLEPAPAGDGFFAAPSPWVDGWLRPAFGLALSYANEPLVLASTSAPDERSAVVAHQTVLHALAALRAFDFALIEVDAPFTLDARGDKETGPFASPSGAAVGDVRVGLRIEALEQRGDWPSAAIGLSVWAPSGDATAYSGAGEVRFAPSLALGARYPFLMWSASAWRRFDEPGGEDLLGSQLGFALAAAGIFEPVQLGVEILGSAVTDRGDDPGEKLSLRVEPLLSARVELAPATLSLLGGPGFGVSPGTPRFRLAFEASVTFDALQPPPDRPEPDDGDGAVANAGSGVEPVAPGPDPVDADADNDGDGVLDREDACPLRAGATGGSRPGCPPDGDGDGIADARDACPTEPGPMAGDPTKNGCPVDTDGDGFVDGVDGCPREPGPDSAEPARRGCPTAVRVEGDRIAIFQPVVFETGSAVIAPESFALLEQVAGVLKADPTIARVAVDGHTDSVGVPPANLLLSQKRALAVTAWLTTHAGIDPRRLEARGFGQRQPIADNGTAQGRAKNRRVEFVILRRSVEGEAGWQDGTVEPTPPPSTAPAAPGPP